MVPNARHGSEHDAAIAMNLMNYDQACLVKLAALPLSGDDVTTLSLWPGSPVSHAQASDFLPSFCHLTWAGRGVVSKVRQGNFFLPSMATERWSLIATQACGLTVPPLRRVLHLNAGMSRFQKQRKD